jgi:hypothetical protein
MEPGKLEEQIRNRLEERTIQPSDKAWDRLEQRLGSERTKQPLFGRGWWYSVAAVFVGAAVVLAIFGNGRDNAATMVIGEPADREAEPSIEVVENPQEADEPRDQEPKELIKAPQSTKPSQRTELAKTEIEDKKKADKKELAPDQYPTVALNESTAVVPENASAIKPVLETSDELFDSQVDKVVAQVQALGEDETQVTADEVERLLILAQRELSSRRIVGRTSGKVDPMALLSEVESEVEQNFREKVFEALGKGFQKIRTAVVERNY